MLRDAPEETVTVRQRRSLRQLPDHPNQHKRHQTHATTIKAQPLRTGATEMPIEKPERNERMHVNNRETEEVRAEPVQRTQRHSYRNGPRPICSPLLFAAQPD